MLAQEGFEPQLDEKNGSSAMDPIHDPIQLVFHDIDGCLNPADGSPIGPADQLSMSAGHKAVLARVNAAIDASTVEHVVIATGRRLADTLFVTEHLPTKKLRYLLVESGALAYDTVTEAYLDLQEIAVSSGVRHLCDLYSDLSQVHGVVAWYRAGGQAVLEERLGSAVPEIPKEAMLTLRVCAAASEVAVMEELRQLLALEESIDLNALNFYTNEARVDVTSRIDKATGARIILAMLGVAPERASMIGDGSNDLPVFELLGRGFCPSNAGDALRRACVAAGGEALDHPFGEASVKVFEGYA
jgi:hydroxymethylpyrimidine pyrophosphatase-like HAD family hydrolase